MGESVSPIYFCKLSREKVVFPNGTQVDPDGTFHFTNGCVIKPIGEHGIDKPNQYEFFKPDGTKIEQEVRTFQTNIDSDGTVHLENGWMMKPVGEHGIGKPNQYEFFEPDGTKIGCG
jgi:hypothetical protein